jgi:Asp-tRNA(Asn)/Glu-tRNA(Gln) amidotransferase A subunit family amidase
LLKFWKAQGIDLLIMPTTPVPAIKCNTGNDTSPLCISYASLWNSYDFPAGSIPITTVREGEEFIESDVKDKPFYANLKGMKDSKGLPIGLQVIGRPNDDELVLNFMKRIESLLEKMDYPQIDLDV